MAARIAVAGALLSAAQLVHGSPVFGNATTPGVVYTTEVVTAVTTYCPAATTLTYNDKTYTITSATTLTITDCPCTISKPVKPTTTSVPQDKCAEKCYDAYNDCRGQPDANFAVCAAEFSSCLGYVPFDDNGSLVTPTACSSGAASTQSPTKPVVYTTEVVTAVTTYCPGPTTLAYNNVTYTVTEPTTLTITNCPCTISKTSSVPSQPTGKDCPQECYDAYNSCRGQPDANMAVCAAKYASCLGYSPFDSNGSLVTPTACSKQAVATTTGVPSKPTGTAHSSAQTTVPANTCAAECYDAYNTCRSQPDANRSTCAANFASCLGYSPFDESGSLVTPTACSSGATGATVPGTAATSAVSTPGVVTAAAGRIAPEHVLLALGAFALL